jgi:hypothetical protein
MASKRPLFQEEMLEALSFGASSVPLPFEAKVRFSYPNIWRSCVIQVTPFAAGNGTVTPA